MNTLKNYIIRVLIIACFSFVVIQLITVLSIIINVSRGYEKLNDDIELLRSVVTQYNTLPTDSVGGIPSSYDNFVNGVLKQSETDIFKYDISIDLTKIYHDRITNNKDLSSDTYIGAYCFQSGTAHGGVNELYNPIRIYTSLHDKEKFTTHDFYSAPNRGGSIYIELTMNVYTPVLSAFFTTDDTFSQNYNRHLTKITAKTTTIGNAHYKSKQENIL